MSGLIDRRGAAGCGADMVAAAFCSRRIVLGKFNRCVRVHASLRIPFVV